MTLKRNILANYLGAGSIALIPILALPWYLQALGLKQFGLIGIVVMLQAVLGLLDAGTSQALMREVTVRLDATDTGFRRAAFLLFGFERVYWLFALGAGCLILALSDVIATQWLDFKELPIDLGRSALYGAAVLFAVQFPGSVYRSVLVAAQAQVALNGIMFCGALARHIGGVIVVFAWPTLTAYLAWHALIALLETLTRARFAWKALNVKRAHLYWKTGELRPVWRPVASMSGAAWLGALTIQVDRIVLSRTASIEQFGYYTIAVMVATGVLQLVYPLVQAVLPQAIQLRAHPAALRILSFKLMGIVGLLSLLGALIFFTSGNWMLHKWLSNQEAATAIFPILAILLLGTALNAFYNVGYVNWLVEEKTHRVFQVNALALVLSVALTPVFVTHFGVIGAAFGWLMINLIGFVLSLEWVIQKQQNDRKS